MLQLASARLYTFVDCGCLHGRAPGLVARQLCDGGSDIIQFRAKGMAIDEVRRMAEEILPITASAGVPLVINDYHSLACEIGVPLCHLGQEDFFDAGHRHISDLTATMPSASKSRPLVGLSTHTPEQATRAMAAGPAYVAIGPVYPTGTKPTARAVTLEYVRWASANVHIPWFAIGGINLDNVDEVLGAGARRICVVSAILNTGDIAEACRKFKQRILEAES